VAADTYSRLQALDKSLSDFKATDSASWATAKIFNALLEAFQREHSGDAIVQAIEPAREGGGHASSMNIGTMRAAIGQLLAVDADSSLI
jgi:hypothetical protein